MGNMETIKTKFAPAERAPQKIIDYQKNVIKSFLTLKPFIDDINHMIIILNFERQIVYANKLFNRFTRNDKLFGQRLGEAVGCIHSHEEEGGCGTSDSCAECGTVNSILNSQKYGVDNRECRITCENNVVYDLDVWTKTITIDDTNFTVVSITDISNEKRRKVLERIFFHDVLNTAGSLRNFLELMRNGSEEEKSEFLTYSLDISNTLIDELKAQRMLVLAEDSKLEIDVTEFSPSNMIEEVISTYEKNYLGENKVITFINNAENTEIIKSDKTLLRRVISNLLKNALEASKDGDRVTLTLEEINSQIVFNVHNTSFIPKNIALQIFQRSFSTKGVGRGIGTYSVKLLTEKYLNGEVSFITDQNLGTTFTVIIPKEIKE
jgi:hypothetical protein